MNIDDYNITEHSRLLRVSTKFRSQDKYLSEENEKEYFKLLSYDVTVERHIFWKIRYEVATLLEAFLNKTISADEFHDYIFELRTDQINKCNSFLSKLESGEIKEFYPDKRAYKLRGLLSALYFACENFELEFDEKELYDSIQNGFLNLQKILREES